MLEAMLHLHRSKEVPLDAHIEWPFHIPYCVVEASTEGFNFSFNTLFVVILRQKKIVYSREKVMPVLFAQDFKLVCYCLNSQTKSCILSCLLALSVLAFIRILVICYMFSFVGRHIYRGSILTLKKKQWT